MITAVFCHHSAPAAATAGKEYLYDYRIIAEYPHDPGNFTQGLFISKGLLYESTGMLRESSLQVRTVDGQLLGKKEKRVVLGILMA